MGCDCLVELAVRMFYLWSKVMGGYRALEIRQIWQRESNGI